MEIEAYINQKKIVYQYLLDFIDNFSNQGTSYQRLMDYINHGPISKDQSAFEDFLYLISKVVKNHHYDDYFFSKITQILLDLKQKIKQTFSNFDTFYLFKSSKRLLLFLFNNGFITIDNEVLEILLSKYSKRFPHFFFPEIKDLVDPSMKAKIEKDFSEEGVDISTIEEKREIGQNDSYLCTLIRNDSIKEFSNYFSQQYFSCDEIIPKSIFETNTFLLDNDTNIFEYAAFFGATKIINFLQYNTFEYYDLEPSLWIYAIHSENSKLIHFLEEQKVPLPSEKYDEVFIEAIKCHHTRISIYIENKYLSDNILKENLVVEAAFRYNNFFYIPEDMNDSSILLYICQYKYLELVDLWMKNKEDTIRENIIQNKKNFFMEFKIIFYF